MNNADCPRCQQYKGPCATKGKLSDAKAVHVVMNAIVDEHFPTPRREFIQDQRCHAWIAIPNGRKYTTHVPRCSRKVPTIDGVSNWCSCSSWCQVDCRDCWNTRGEPIKQGTLFGD